jgi:hypothetical protein
MSLMDLDINTLQLRLIYDALDVPFFLTVSCYRISSYTLL